MECLYHVQCVLHEEQILTFSIHQGLEAFDVARVEDVTDLSNRLIKHVNDCLQVLELVRLLLTILSAPVLIDLELHSGPVLLHSQVLLSKLKLLLGCGGDVDHLLLFVSDVELHDLAEHPLLLLKFEVLHVEELLDLVPVVLFDVLVSEGVDDWHCLLEVRDKLDQVIHSCALRHSLLALVSPEEVLLGNLGDLLCFNAVEWNIEPLLSHDAPLLERVPEHMPGVVRPLHVLDIVEWLNLHVQGLLVLLDVGHLLDERLAGDVVVVDQLDHHINIIHVMLLLIVLLKVYLLSEDGAVGIQLWDHRLDFGLHLFLLLISVLSCLTKFIGELCR